MGQAHPYERLPVGGCLGPLPRASAGPGGEAGPEAGSRRVGEYVRLLGGVQVLWEQGELERVPQVSEYFHSPPI